MASDPCPKCGANRVMVGYVHRCVSVTKIPVTKNVVTINRPASVTKIPKEVIPKKEVVGKRGRGRPRKERVLTGAERTRRWRSRVSGGGMC